MMITMLVNICLFFVIAIYSPSLAITPAFQQPWIPEARQQRPWMSIIWMDKFRANVENTRVNGSKIHLLFFGDSITEVWDKDIWNRTYAPFGATNYGLGAERTQNVLWRIMNGEVDNISPKLIVLKIGTNNLLSNVEADIARGVIAIIDELRIRLPKTKILVSGILPRNNLEVTAMTDRLNTIIARADNGKTVRYLNMRDAFYAGNGTFLPGLFMKDLLHLTPAGYAKWQVTMHPLFTEMWNAP